MAYYSALKRNEHSNHEKTCEVKVQVTQSCPTLCCPMDYTVHGILQARIPEWVAIPFSRGSFPPRERTQVSRIAGRFFTSWATREAQRNLKCISRSERKQSEEGRHCMIPTKWHSGKGQTMEMGKRSVVARGWGNGRDEEVEQRALYGSENILLLWRVHVMIHFPNPRMHDARSEPECKVWTWGDCVSVWVHHWWQVCPRMGMLVMRRPCMCGGWKHVGNLCAFLSVLLWT